MTRLVYVPDRIIDHNGIADAATVYVYLSGTTTPVALFSDSLMTVSMANPFTVAAGAVFPNIYYDSSVEIKLRIISSVDGSINEYDPYSPLSVDVTSGASISYSTHTAIAAIPSPITNQVAYLTEAGRQGMFAWTTGDQSAHVSVDTRQGIYIAPVSDTTGASGAWVRQNDGSRVNVRWFGCAADDATSDNAAFVAALAWLKHVSINPVVTWYKGGGTLYIPMGNYYMGTTPIDVTFTVTIEGEDKSFGGSTQSTRLRWGPGCCGFRFQSYDSSGDTTVTDGSGFTASDGSILRHVHLMGGLQTTATEGEYHGILIKCIMQVENVGVTYWQGDGFHVVGDVGIAGNVSLTQLSQCWVHHVRTGYYIQGGDASVCTVKSCSAIYCRRWGFWDSGFLGNRFQGCHASACGIFNTGYTPCVASIGGALYGVVFSQDSGASTNAPPSSTVTITIASPGVVTWTSHGLAAGTDVAFSTTGALPTGLAANTRYYVVNPTANTFQVATTRGGTAINTSGSQSGTHTSGAGIDNTWWLYAGIGGPSSGLNYVAWTSGLTWRSGGAYLNDHPGAPSTFDDCYSEGGDPPSQLLGLSLAIGGLKGSRHVGAYCYGYAGGLASNDLISAIDYSSGHNTALLSGVSASEGFLRHTNPIALGSPGMVLGFPNPSATNTVIYWTMYRTYYGDDAVPIQISGYSTSLSDASWGPAQFNFPVGFGHGGKKRRIGTVAPAAGAWLVGDIVYNSAPTAGGNIGWVCTTAGSPGTWKTFGAIAA